jgi:hypothetical protein
VRIPIENRELYDMETDRTETRNLAAAHPELVQQLVREWELRIAAPQEKQRKANP